MDCEPGGGVGTRSASTSAGGKANGLGGNRDFIGPTPQNQEERRGHIMGGGQGKGFEASGEKRAGGRTII